MLIAGAIAGECRLNGASQQRMIGQDPWGNGWGGGGEGGGVTAGWGVGGCVTSPAHDNRGEDSVWENRGGARAGREREREGREAQSLRERARERTRHTVRERESQRN